MRRRSRLWARQRVLKALVELEEGGGGSGIGVEVRVVLT
jgi:hypothetical protein